MPLIQQQRFNPNTGQIESVWVDTDTSQTIATVTNTPPQTGPLQPPAQNPAMGGQPAAAPATGFSARHPKLAGVLSNLGPALSAINTEPLPTTAYPQSGFAQFGQILGRAGQTFQTADQNIQKERVSRATKKAAEPGLRKLEAGTPLDQMSQNDLYGLTLSGVPQPPALSGAEQRQGALSQAGITMTAAQKAETETRNRQIDAEIDYQGKLLGLRKDEIDVQKQQIRQHLQESRADFVRQIGASTAAQYNAAATLFDKMYNGEKLTKEDEAGLEGLAAPNLVRAQAAGAAAKVRGQVLIQNITDLLNKKPGLSDDDRLKVNYALLRLQSITSDPSIFLYYPGARDEYEKAIKDIESVMPEAKAALPTSKGILSTLFDSITDFVGGKAKDLGNAALSVKPTAGNDRAEYDALIAEAQRNGNKLPPDKAARLKELATQYGAGQP